MPKKCINQKITIDTKSMKQKSGEVPSSNVLDNHFGLFIDLFFGVLASDLLVWLSKSKS